MPRKLITVLGTLAAFLTIVASAPAATFTVDGRHVDVYGGHTAKRLFLFHGLNGNRGFVTEPAFKPLLAGLRSQGWQVISPDEFYDGEKTHQARSLRHAFSADPTAGLAYRRSWQRYVNRIIAWADRKYGRATVYVGGVSWGGFHALLTACGGNPRISGYFAQTPVVDPRSLLEFQASRLRNLTPWSGGCSQRLARLRGYVSYGGQDTRVGTKAVTRLLSNLHRRGARVTEREFPLMGHSTTPAAVAGILSWIR